MLSSTPCDGHSECRSFSSETPHSIPRLTDCQPLTTRPQLILSETSEGHQAPSERGTGRIGSRGSSENHHLAPAEVQIPEVGSGAVEISSRAVVVRDHDTDSHEHWLAAYADHVIVRNYFDLNPLGERSQGRIPEHREGPRATP